jgi:hypothetical protein
MHALARSDVSAFTSKRPAFSIPAEPHSQSVPGTRQHFTKILCGYDDPPRSGEKRAAAARKEKEKEKEKKPISRVNYKSFTGAYEM